MYDPFKTKRPNAVVHREDGVTEIALTKGKVALILTRDYPKVRYRRWHANVQKRTTYAETYVKINGVQSTRGMHQFLRRCEPPFEVDHKDGDGLNNRSGNLRKATPKQNSWNRSVAGVYWYPKSQKWLALIKVDGKLHYLGLFPVKERALKARKLAEKKYRAGFRVFR